jgi:hypothetical protein
VGLISRFQVQFALAVWMYGVRASLVLVESPAISAILKTIALVVALCGYQALVYAILDGTSLFFAPFYFVKVRGNAG